MTLHLNRRSFSRTVLVGAGLAAMLAAIGGSRSIRAVAGARPLLIISGKVTAPDGGSTMQFDRAALEALGMTSFVTKTPWYPDPVLFEGVAMTRLMTAVSASGETLVATALNDYVTEIPITDLAKFNVLLALKRNGEYMPTRDKGPLFIIYPFDSEPTLHHQRYYSRSAWQLASIVVR